MSSPNRYALTITTRVKRCSRCRVEVPAAGLIAVARSAHGPHKALCDSCLESACPSLARPSVVTDADALLVAS